MDWSPVGWDFGALCMVTLRQEAEEVESVSIVSSQKLSLILEKFLWMHEAQVTMIP